ncbi:hypothetical protein FB451DRAFT_1183591 [Mycena latifolia]|nr:hypothetical protein FB451DRAFT_1183591 [Mycena latifolia]
MPNLCRAVVVYMPVWKPYNLEADLDEVPPLISEEELLKLWPVRSNGRSGSIRCIAIDGSFTRKNRYRPRVDPSSAESVEHFNYMTWYLPGLGHAPVPQTYDMQRGERYPHIDYVPALSTRKTSFLSLRYDEACHRECKCACHMEQVVTGTVNIFPGRLICLWFGPADANNGERTKKKSSSVGYTADGHISEESEIWAQMALLWTLSGDISARMVSKYQLPCPASMSDLDFVVYTDEDIAASVLLSFGSDDTTVYGTDVASPKSLSAIDGEDSESEVDIDQYGNCDFCGDALGLNAPKPCCFFRCLDCKEAIHCEACCYEIHLGARGAEHRVDEWDIWHSQWGRKSLAETGLQSTYAMHCSSCCDVITPAGSDMPVGTLDCDQCGSGLLCPSCCLEDHAAKPLHTVKRWSGQFWESKSLRDVGFVYQMGHEGRACANPGYLTSLLVIDWMMGCHSLPLRYCECGKYMGGMWGRWQQIMTNGWHPLSLNHMGVCATFEVRQRPRTSS